MAAYKSLPIVMINKTWCGTKLFKNGLKLGLMTHLIAGTECNVNIWDFDSRQQQADAFIWSKFVQTEKLEWLQIKTENGTPRPNNFH